MNNQLPLCFVNGVLGGSISPWDRGFAYGDGLFETCRIYKGRVPLWSLHRQRLLGDSQKLAISCDSRQLDDYVQQALVEAQELTHGVLKIVLTRGVGGRGYQTVADMTSSYCVYLLAGNQLQTSSYVEGGRARICHHRLPTNPRLAGIKHLNRLDQIIARAEWQQEFDDGLLLDQQGNLLEGISSNLFVVVNNKLLTPALINAGVAGVMRQLVIEELAPALGLTVEIKPVSLNDLKDASELLLTNSLAGIWPVVALAAEDKSWQFGKGPVCVALQNLLEQRLFAGDAV